MMVGVDAPDPDEQSGNELIGVVAQDGGVRIIIKAPLDDTSGILISMAGVSTQGSPGGLCSSVYVSRCIPGSLFPVHMAFQYPTLLCKCVWNNIPSEPYFDISHIAMTTSMLVPLFECILLLRCELPVYFTWCSASALSPPLTTSSSVNVDMQQSCTYLTPAIWSFGKWEAGNMLDVVWPESKEDGKRREMFCRVNMEAFAGVGGIVTLVWCYNVTN